MRVVKYALSGRKKTCIYFKKRNTTTLYLGARSVSWTGGITAGATADSYAIKPFYEPSSGKPQKSSLLSGLARGGGAKGPRPLKKKLF